MIDLEHSGPCCRVGCPNRRIRFGFCLQHLREFAGPDHRPWPHDMRPRTSQENLLARRHGRTTAA